MSIIDKAPEANRNYAKKYNPTLGKRPAPKIAVVTCMDPRLSGILGLRHAGLDDASPAPMRFFSYKDPEENTREQIKKVRSHPWISKDVPVRGFVFDVHTGRLCEVKLLENERAA